MNEPLACSLAAGGTDGVFELLLSYRCIISDVLILTFWIEHLHFPFI